MADSTWSALVAVSISAYVFAVAAGRGWLDHAVDLTKAIARRVARRG